MLGQNRERIHIEQKSDGIIISVLDLYTNCASKYSMNVNVEESLILVNFYDISTQKARCNCYIDLSMHVNQIPPGDYKMIIQKNEFKRYGYTKDTSFIIHTQNLKVKSNNTRMMLANKIEQSDCKKQERSIEKNISKEISVLTNPLNSTFTIILELSEDTDVNIQLLNMLGKQVFSTTKTGLTKGMNNLTINAKDLNPGIYIGKVTTESGKMYSFRLSWSK